MAKAIRVIVKSESGYFSHPNAVKEKMIITDKSVSYKMKPMYILDESLNYKWSYKIDSVIHRQNFDNLVLAVQNVVENSEIEHFLDCGNLSIEVVYDDKTRIKYEDYVPISTFLELTHFLKEFVPHFKLVPPFLDSY